MKTMTTTLAALAVLLLAAGAFADEPCKIKCKTPCSASSAKAVAVAVAADGEEKEIKVEVEEKDGLSLVKIYEIKDGEKVLIRELETDGEHEVFDLSEDGNIVIMSGDDHKNVWHARHGDGLAALCYGEDGDHFALFGGGAFMGIQMQDLNEQLADYFGGEGVLVSEVVEDSPAEKAGLKAGDVVVKIDGETMSDPSDIQTYISEKEKDDEVEVRVLRKGDEKTFKVTLGEREGMENVHAWVGGDGEHFDLQKHFRHFAPGDDHEVIIKRLHKDGTSDEMDELRDEIEKLKEEIEKLKK